MAAPIIDSVTPAQVALNPGQFQDVTIVAHDPDSGTGSGTVDVNDSQGNTTPVGIVLTVNDPLSFVDQGTDLPGVTSQIIDTQPTQVTVRYTAA
jgi:hypothetical protein